ncbi:hypothetical protein [Muricoccus pecuniae]|uniref:Uncharacterized protein n=1 Tax=Muricoccus pecuniae TaxID=693023 RepID=A0A840YHX6_9PROT|nr:hypothetical protein [Roseomonas pecuniae]MBB5694152.1 hypothetical protein [Roseomonas pecuniae]
MSAAGARPAEAAPAGPPPSPGLLREEAVFPVGRGEEPPPPAYPSALVLVPSAPAAAAKRPLALLAAAWAASVLLLAGAAAAAWSWRVDLVEAWPPAARAFIALGLAG